MTQTQKWRVIAALFIIGIIPLAFVGHGTNTPAALPASQRQPADLAQIPSQAALTSPTTTSPSSNAIAETVPVSSQANPIDKVLDDVNRSTATPNPIANSDDQKVARPADAPPDCDASYPCQLQTIIDHSDWEDVRSALAFAVNAQITDSVSWKGKANGHTGYIKSLGIQDEKGCTQYNVVSLIGGVTGSKIVAACKNDSGDIDIE